MARWHFNVAVTRALAAADGSAGEVWKPSIKRAGACQDWPLLYREPDPAWPDV